MVAVVVAVVVGVVVGVVVAVGVAVAVVMTERYDYQQQESDERRYAEEHPDSFAAYWLKREQDMKEEKEFWRKWAEKFGSGAKTTKGTM